MIKTANGEKRERHGFTLIEMLVVLSITGLLLGIVIPAVQSARGSARRLQCAQNLHQMGLALANYSSTFGQFPQGGNGNGYSNHAMLLPSVDQQVIYNAINQNFLATGIEVDAENATISSCKVSTYYCPANFFREDTRSSGTSYAGSRGFDDRLQETNGVFPRGNRCISYRDVTDGSSSTIMIAEWVQGPRGNQSIDPQGTIFAIDPGLNGVSQLSSFSRVCGAINVTVNIVNSNDKGRNWFFGEYQHTLFNHNMPINSFSCLSDGGVQAGAFSAGSKHPGGVNVLFTDGHAQFVKQQVDLAVWQSLGSRSRGEVIDSADY